MAIDRYAQADDGSVWYFGEDYSAFEDGKVSDTEGTWVVDDKAPAALIMPAHPRVGDVYRPENVPEVVFEEVRVDKVDLNVAGPSGNISGAMEVNELHMDGTREGKIVAPDTASSPPETRAVTWRRCRSRRRPIGGRIRLPPNSARSRPRFERPSRPPPNTQSKQRRRWIRRGVPRSPKAFRRRRRRR